jgi:hypothetical protein
LIARGISKGLQFAAVFSEPVSRPRGTPPKRAHTRAETGALGSTKAGSAGRTDRSQYAPAYGAQVTDDAVKVMSRALNGYGASPLRGEIVQTRKIDEQTFYVVKFVFPRGDATSLLFGFDTAGKITGIGVSGMAGD